MYAEFFHASKYSLMVGVMIVIAVNASDCGRLEGLGVASCREAAWSANSRSVAT